MMDVEERFEFEYRTHSPKLPVQLFGVCVRHAYLVHQVLVEQLAKFHYGFSSYREQGPAFILVSIPWQLILVQWIATSLSRNSLNKFDNFTSMGVGQGAIAPGGGSTGTSCEDNTGEDGCPGVDPNACTGRCRTGCKFSTHGKLRIEWQREYFLRLSDGATSLAMAHSLRRQ